MNNQIQHIENRGVKSSSVNRRDFLKSSGLLAAGMSLAPWSFGSTHQGMIDAAWPETGYNYLTPLFLLHSTGRLALGSAFIHSGIKHALTTDVRSIVPGNSFHLGALVPFAGVELLPALDKIKTDMNLGKLDQANTQKLALIIGAISHQSAMKHLENINSFDEKGISGNPECQVYQDAKVIRSYYSKGKTLDTKNQEDIKSLIGQMIPRTFIRFHTVMPDDADGAAWVMNTAKWRKQSDDYFGELARAIATPDSNKTRKYIENTHFMDGNDLILKRVSAFAKISEVSPEQAIQLMDPKSNGSVLASSLANAYRSVIAVNNYIAGTLQRSELENALTH
ncbi:MAG: twin-arginine translocation signal domain-containing protein [Cyclobacteriaceae bacterium]|nr:twin-arginine translocation signal domain-containing protein [Cyclobacteriaceae bacterium]